MVIAACPNSACGLGLLDVAHCIKGMPAVKIGWRYTDEKLRDGKDHKLFVSAIWGDHTIHSDVDIVNGRVLDLFCPFCKQEFPKVAHCVCNAKMVAIKSRYVHDGKDGLIQVCARRGCPEHRKIRQDEVAAVAGLQAMCGGMRGMDAAALRVIETGRQR
jgi:hypothetical protein